MIAWAQLMLGLGSLITGITGAALAIYSVHLARKEPRRAAEHALEEALELLMHQHHHIEPPDSHALPPANVHHDPHHGGGTAP